MSLTVASLMQNLDTLQGRDFETVYKKRHFKLLFHDTVKLRIRLEHRDISVPLSILLLGIAQLLARKEFSRQMCIELLGKEWGYGYIARMLLECEDVCLKPDCQELVLSRVRPVNGKNGPVKPPPNGNSAKNPNPNGG
jgi:hypothetical protein